jgi:DNA-binding MarR family transcriptional regulator/GNAT superfamily N-acetyltransferase
VRRFNRFYTRRIGVLDRGHLHSAFSLAEARVLYEIANWSAAHERAATATDIGRELGLDRGYLSRILRRFERLGILTRRAAADDARRHELRLTTRGRATFADLDRRARDDIAALIAPLGDDEQRALLSSLHTVENVLQRATITNDTPSTDLPFTLREPHPGDYGWVVARHGAIYSQEYGWDARFEGLVARIVAEYLEQHDETRERAWIAEHAGTRAGSVFLVRHPERDGVARLRLLLVEPPARGLGIGQALVRACTTFAREVGYHTITLWTNSVLTAARRIYESEGYTLVEEKPHRSFGYDLVGQTWELLLER